VKEIDERSRSYGTSPIPYFCLFSGLASSARSSQAIGWLAELAPHPWSDTLLASLTVQRRFLGEYKSRHPILLRGGCRMKCHSVSA
jgi:hypothetical protein